MSQKRDEYLTRWKERIEDQAHAIRIVQQYERDMRARKDGKSEEEITNLPPVETKSVEVLVRKFINRMDSRFSMFSELYTRGERLSTPPRCLMPTKKLNAMALMTSDLTKKQVTMTALESIPLRYQNSAIFVLEDIILKKIASSRKME